MARRANGYCPKVAATASSRLPFDARCVVDDGLGGAYVPDEATAQSAAQELCSMAGCLAAVAKLAADAPELGASPQCSEQSVDDREHDPTVAPWNTSPKGFPPK